MNRASRLEYSPISFFAVAMGLAGLTLAWEKAQSVYGIDLHINGILTAITGGLFLTFLLFTQIRRFTRLEFFLSGRAYSFPIAAITLSTPVIHEQTGMPGLKLLAALFLGILTLIVDCLSYRTGLAVSRKKVCLPEG